MLSSGIGREKKCGDGLGLDVDGVLVRVCVRRCDEGPATGVSGVSSVLCRRAWTAAGGTGEDEPDDRADISVWTCMSGRLCLALDFSRMLGKVEGGAADTGRTSVTRWLERRGIRGGLGAGAEGCRLSAIRDMRVRCDVSSCVS